MAVFKIKKNVLAAQPYHFVLVADNGQILCTSENYSTKQSAKSAIESIRKIAANATLEDATGELFSAKLSLD